MANTQHEDGDQRSHQLSVSESPWAKLKFLSKRVHVKYRELGFFRTLQLIEMNIRDFAENYISERYDRLYEVKTAGYIELQDLVIPNPNKQFGIRYQPTTHRRLVAMFSALPSDLSSFTFIDFGSGRGRVLLFASRFKFKKVLGVEFSEELHRSAVENIAIAKTKNLTRSDVQSHHQDATQFEIPDGPLILYFFDPFRDHVMQQVLDRIKNSYLSDPREIYLMYHAPVHATMVEAMGLFRKLETRKLPHEFSLRHQYQFALYATAQAAQV